jgi:hypothetical protein
MGYYLELLKSECGVTIIVIVILIVVAYFYNKSSGMEMFSTIMDFPVNGETIYITNEQDSIITSEFQNEVGTSEMEDSQQPDMKTSYIPGEAITNSFYNPQPFLAKETDEIADFKM